MGLEIHRTERYVSIEVNGVKYDSLDDVPEPYRSMLADHDADGVPDMFQGAEPQIAVSKTIIESGPRSGRRFTRPLDSTSFSCAECGYNLTGSQIGGRCPECGSPVMESIRRITHPRPSRFWRIIDMCIEPNLFSVTVFLVILLLVILALAILL
jgi:hypothetical protein